MCLSMCGQIIYGILLLVCIILTSIALFTGGWVSVKYEGVDSVKKLEHLDHYAGIMPWTCVSDNKGSVCENWWSTRQFWEKAVVVMMCAALIVQLFALVWNLISFLACCCKKWIIHPLGPLACIFTCLLISSVVTYGLNNQDAVRVSDSMKPDLTLGWSFWMAVGATIFGTATTIVGAVTVCCADKHM